MTQTLITSSSRWFISTAIAGLLPLVAQTCAPTPKGLSAWVSFDEPLFRNQPNRIEGQVGKAMHFDGTSQFFQMPYTPGFNVGEGDFSIELWTRTTVKKATRNIVDYRSEDPKGWLIFIRRETVGFQIADGSHVSNVIAANYPISDGRWHHIVAVGKRLPPQSPMIFVDGVLRAQEGKHLPLSNLDHAIPLWFARHHRNAVIDREDVYFGGDIDELSVYRRVLTPAEISSLFRAGHSGKCRK